MNKLTLIFTMSKNYLKSIIIGLVPPFIISIIKKFKHLIIHKNDLNYEQDKYIIEGFDIEIPQNHTIRLFQKQHLLYDRFLPVLCKYMNESSTIVDIGANVGDTLFSIIKKTKSKIICIEPSNVYFDYLEKNIRKLPEKYKNRVQTYKHFISCNKVSGELKHLPGGSAKLVNSGISNQIETRSLDDLLKNSSDISLIKVDTDGYDYDVLLSAKESIKKNSPILFWENYFENIDQIDGFNKLYAFLESERYEQICVFDNFGNILLKHATYESLKNINNYIYNNENKLKSNTIFYTDVLAYKAEHKNIIDDVFSEFEKKYSLLKNN